MVEPNVERALLEILGELSKDKQHDVLKFAQRLQNRVPLTSSKTLLKFAGCLPPETCDAMEKAIEEECERIDPDGW